MTIDLTAYTDTDLESLRVAVLNEQNRRYVLTTAAAQAAAIAQQYADAAAVDPVLSKPVPAGQLPAVAGPGTSITWTDGNVWTNRSGAFLSPAIAGPGKYPMGWSQVTGLPTSVSPWAVGVAYYIADATHSSASLVTYNGKTYRCLQAHTSQAGWTPVAAVSLWTLA